MNGAPRVLHVVESWPPVPSGYASRSHWIVRSQARLGVAVPAVLVTSRQQVYGEHAHAEPDGLPVEQVEPSHRERARRDAAPAPFRRPFHVDVDHLRRSVEHAARRHAADLVHVHWASGIGRAAVQAARNLSLPAVAELRFDLAGAMLAQSARGYGRLVEPLARRWFERHVDGAAAVVVASDALGTLVRRTHGLSEQALTVVPNGIDPAFVTACDRARQEHDEHGTGVAAGSPVTVGTTSKMLHYEGLDTLIRTAVALPDIDLVFIGDGPERARLEAQAAPLNRERPGRVRFTGVVPKTRIPELLATIDVFAVPRRELSITRYASPIKVIEAMAAARCTVATAVGDQAVLLGEGRGTLVAPGDGRAFTDAIAARVADAHGRRRIGHLARHHALERYDGDTLIRRYASVYHDALSAPRSSG